MESRGKEQSQETKQVPSYQSMQDKPIQTKYEAPKVINEEPKDSDHGSLEVLEKYEYGELAESNIPDYLRWGANPDQSSLDPRERIEQNHGQLAALTTSVGRFLGGIWDAVRNWGAVPNPRQESTTEKMEKLAEKLVPYDRMQPGYGMLQTTSDILVDSIGFSAIGGMGASIGKGGMNVGSIQQINPGRLEVPTQIAARNLVEESAFLQRMNQPAWRSGVGTQKPMMLNEFRTIKPLVLPKITDPVEMKWFRDAASKVGDLQIKYGSRFDQKIKVTFANQELSELQIRRILDHAGFGTYLRPTGLPKDCLVELSKKNGGMIYRKPGTTENENIIVRIIDGTREENIITATIEGKYLGHWRQQTPYVVQRKGELYLTRDGEWIKDGRDPRAHIPLEIFEFKGW